jgi:hypothetical protein
MTGRAVSLHPMMMPPFLYQCPRTALRVQGWTEVEESEWTEDTRENVICLACGNVHLVNPKSGRAPGEEAE